MAAYIFIYVQLSRHYKALQLKYYPRHLKDEDVKVMRKELLALLLFIVSVCQIYVLRDLREILWDAGLASQALQFNGIIYQALQVCKTLMVLGISVAIYHRVKAKKATFEGQSSFRRAASLGASLMLFDEDE